MKQAIDSDILFDDRTIIEAIQGAGYFGNISVSNNMDCTNNINDCTNNFYAPLNDEKFSTAQIA